MQTSVDDALRLCSVYNQRKRVETTSWRLDMFSFACMVNADKEGRKKLLEAIQKEEKKALTPEQEREALLKLKTMLK